MLKLLMMAARQSSGLSTTAMIALDELEQDIDLTPRPKTPSPPPPTVLLSANDDDTGTLNSEACASSQTERIFRRFVVEMDSRRRQCLRGQLAEPGSTPERRRVSSTSSSSSSFPPPAPPPPPPSSSSSSSDPAAAAAATARDEDDDQLLS